MGILDVHMPDMRLKECRLMSRGKVAVVHFVKGGRMRLVVVWVARRGSAWGEKKLVGVELQLDACVQWSRAPIAKVCSGVAGWGYWERKRQSVVERR